MGNITTKSLLEIIGEFIKDADGEFIVQIVTSRKVIIFNNYIGSLPLYYTDDPNCIIISREIKTILEFAERIEPDRKRLTEYLMFEHALGIGTIFKNIYRIESASVLEVDLIHKNLHVYKSSDWNFVQEASPKDKKGLICELVVSLDNAVQNRVKVFECEGYKISADLSGGHDSRVILALLARYTKDVNYLTFEYIQDESSKAKSVYKRFDSPGYYKKLKHGKDNVNESILQQIWKTDG